MRDNPVTAGRTRRSPQRTDHLRAAEPRNLRRTRRRTRRARSSSTGPAGLGQIAGEAPDRDGRRHPARRQGDPRRHEVGHHPLPARRAAARRARSDVFADAPTIQATKIDIAAAEIPIYTLAAEAARVQPPAPVAAVAARFPAQQRRRWPTACASSSPASRACRWSARACASPPAARSIRRTRPASPP